MSRYTITLLKGERTDDEASIGFDPPLRTFFLQGFETDDEFGTPEIWLGALLEEFPTLEGIIEEARREGYEVRDLDQADMNAMLAEGGHDHEPSIAEKLGFIRSQCRLPLLPSRRGRSASDRLSPASSGREGRYERSPSPSPRPPLPARGRLNAPPHSCHDGVPARKLVD